MSLKALVIHESDNVANLIGPGKKGQTVICVVENTDKKTEIELLDDIPANHKFAYTNIDSGVTVLKYGLSIGKASKSITKGEHVHTHNIESNRGRGDLS